MTRKRGPYSSPRQRERRRRILHEAGRLVQEVGYSALSMQSIAAASDVSPRTLYNQFGTLDLLLLDAAEQMLEELGDSGSVVREDAGIPQLLAFTAGTMRQFVEGPEYAHAVIAILLRADLAPDDAYERLGPVQRFAHRSLRIAQERGELRDDVDPQELSWLISSNEWGAVLQWEKGLLRVEQLEHLITLNNCMTLLPACRGARRRDLENRIKRLLRQPAGPGRIAAARDRAPAAEDSGTGRAG